MRYINEVAKNMARSGLKIGMSLGCAFHFESEFICITEHFTKLTLRDMVIGKVTT